MWNWIINFMISAAAAFVGVLVYFAFNPTT